MNLLSGASQSVVVLIATLSGLATICNFYRQYKSEIISPKSKYYRQNSEDFIVYSHKLACINILPILSLFVCLAMYNYFIKDIFNAYIIFFCIFFILFIFQYIIIEEKIRKLKMICNYITEDTSNLFKNKFVKYEFFNIVILNYIVVCPLIITLQINVNIKIVISILEITLFVILIIVYNVKVISYKHKAYIISKTTIQVDYTHIYGCKCNIILKRNFSMKIIKEYICIYYPNDIALYMIPQVNVMNISIGYELINVI